MKATSDDVDSSDSPSVSAAAAGPAVFWRQLQQQLQSGHIDNSSSKAMNATPLLKASLNSPPVATHHHSRPSSPEMNNNNGSVDLSVAGSAAKRQRLEKASSSSSSSSPPPPPQMEEAAAARLLQTEKFSTLLLQLRQNNSFSPSPPPPPPSSLSRDTSSPSSPPTTGTSQKLTAAARKRKLKAQPCFQCPVCKKRFQRHIALNAHFQNEHLGQSSADKVCRLCGQSLAGSSIAEVRTHLLRQHGIDLETPNACLVEPESEAANGDNGNATTKQNSSNVVASTLSRHPKFRANKAALVLKASSPSRECGLEESSSASSASPSSSSTPSPVSEATLDVKKEPLDNVTNGNDEQARDLSLKRTTNVEDVNRVSMSEKRKRSCEELYRCRHCEIVFPNQTLYFLHRGFHSEGDPWRCNGCTVVCSDMYDFNAHLVSFSHR